MRPRPGVPSSGPNASAGPFGRTGRSSSRRFTSDERREPRTYEVRWPRLMDIHQLRSWIFELYEPLEDERQYIVFDSARGNLLIDAPPFSERALRMIRGAGPASVLLITNGAHGADAARYRDAL